MPDPVQGDKRIDIVAYSAACFAYAATNCNKVFFCEFALA